MNVERIVPDEHYSSSYSSYVEHLGRYQFASRQAGTNAKVLDLGCGCGYGTAHLAEIPGRHVIGLDLSAEATGYGRRHYRMPRLNFLNGTAASLPLRNGAVDAVVALEMLEHVNDPKAVLAEIHRVLKPGGLCVVSTPNRLVTGSGEVPDNPYHVKEYTPEELRALLSGSFKEYFLYGQAETPACTALRENMACIWQNLSLIPLIQQELESLRAKLEMDERVTGLAWLRRIARWLRGDDLTPTVAGALSVSQSFRYSKSLLHTVIDLDITPYDLESAAVLIAVCRT